MHTSCLDTHVNCHTIFISLLKGYCLFHSIKYFSLLWSTCCSRALPLFYYLNIWLLIMFTIFLSFIISLYVISQFVSRALYIYWFQKKYFCDRMFANFVWTRRHCLFYLLLSFGNFLEFPHVWEIGNLPSFWKFSYSFWYVLSNLLFIDPKVF